MTEIHGINETLILIRAGTYMQNGGFETNFEKYDFNTFQAMDEVEDFFDQNTYAIDESKIKGRIMKNVRKCSGNSDDFSPATKIGGGRNRKKGKKGRVIQAVENMENKEDEEIIS